VIAIGIKADLRPLQRAMIDLGAKQVPFAMSLAVNNLAKGAQAEERKAVDQTFKSPTPFTENAFRTVVATKSRPIAVVAVKDIQAEYLEPYVVGGDRSLGMKRGMLAPRGVNLNQYGNLSKNTLQRLKGKPGVFIGRVTFKKTGRTINGVWQRPAAGTRRDGSRGTKGNTANRAGGTRTGLKLLIQFEDTTPVPKRFPFEQRARSYVSRHAAAEFNAALQRALATAQR
jgi:hypothetical protein